MMLVVQDAAKKPFVGLVHQLINIGHVRWTVIEVIEVKQSENDYMHFIAKSLYF